MEMLDRKQLIRILNKFASLHQDEILEAALEAERLRRDAGVSWEDLIPIPDQADSWAHVEAAQACLQSRVKLNDFELEFLDGVQRTSAP
jgi:hypothetical protein